MTYRVVFETQDMRLHQANFDATRYEIRRRMEDKGAVIHSIVKVSRFWYEVLNTDTDEVTDIGIMCAETPEEARQLVYDMYPPFKQMYRLVRVELEDEM